MKIILIIIIIVMLQLEQVYGLPINDPNCMKYLSKLMDFCDGTCAKKTSFAGDVSFNTKSSNAQVNIRYIDADFFNDPVYFGLVKEDGKTDEEVCLELKLWKYTSNSYADPVQVTDFHIKSSNNYYRQWRYYSFIIPQNEFKTRLIETSNSNQFIYTGYYAIAYYAVGTDKLQYAFFFEFSLVIDKETGFAIETAFKPLSELSTEGCTISTGCNVKPDTQLKWCTDLTCTAFLTPDLHLNDEFVLQQVITTPKLSNYYLINTEIQYKGNGLLKKAIPIYIMTSFPGYIIIQLKAEIAWNEVTIVVTSTLKTLEPGLKRVRVQKEYDPVYGETDQIECIKAEGSERCTTCEQECDANGFARNGCSSCSFYKYRPFYFLAIVLIFAIALLNQSDIKQYIF